jgi:hypothetical protein
LGNSRSVFLGLGTRRLGKSGESKYHYTGIRIKPGSSLNHMIEDGTSIAVCQQTSKKKRKLSCPSNDECGKIGIEYEEITRHSSSYRVSSTSLEVDWLMENFECGEGMALPRSSMYDSYIHYCSENGLASVNTASLGKLLHSLFLGLGTRRLGKRGEAKYYYTGIRIRPGSALNHMIEAICQQPSKKKRKLS